MRILAIETSCDETGVSIVEATGGIKKPSFKVLADITVSQIPLHAKYGGVFPMMAKREHAKNLIPLLEKVLREAKLLNSISNLQFTIYNQSSKYKLLKEKLKKLLEREPELFDKFIEFIPAIKPPKLDAIAVTYGPGLEPTLWVGINFAKALSLVWNIPVVPINHMEGHMFSALLKTTEKRGLEAEGRGKNPPRATSYKLQAVRFPAVALLISGGHTELVLMKDWMKYKIIGETRDDAVGEAFDKVARMLGLPYPGGPQISALAKFARNNAERTQKIAEKNIINAKILRNSALSLRESALRLPRPMIHSGDFDFSFSGLKTSVLYMIKKIPKLTREIKAELAREFENAVTEVLTAKTISALNKYEAKTLILGGGVAANENIRETIKRKIGEKIPDCAIYLPNKSLTGDNALMIAVAGYFRNLAKKLSNSPKIIRAEGNLRL